MNNSTIDFVMHIVDVFKFEDGKTILCGEVEGDIAYIGESECDIVVDGRVIQRIKIEGEMIPRKLRNDTQRSVSTSNKLEIDSQLISKHKVKLKGNLGH